MEGFDYCVNCGIVEYSGDDPNPVLLFARKAIGRDYNQVLVFMAQNLPRPKTKIKYYKVV